MHLASMAVASFFFANLTSTAGVLLPSLCTAYGRGTRRNLLVKLLHACTDRYIHHRTAVTRVAANARSTNVKGGSIAMKFTDKIPRRVKTDNDFKAT